MFLTMSRYLGLILIITAFTYAHDARKCEGNGLGLKYIWGDALTDSADCIGPNNMQYPSAAISRSFKNLWAGSSRTARSHQPRTIDPELTRKALLHNYKAAHGDYSIAGSSRNGRAFSTKESCGSPARLCKTRYNTTAPMYGISLTSGQPVTIVQKFPDLLQQVVFEVCESKECDVVHGECTQTFVPYLFLVIPLGPVTLTGQDYVLVEKRLRLQGEKFGGCVQRRAAGRSKLLNVRQVASISDCSLSGRQKSF